ncbi:MAG: ferrous iron transporter B, partial [bacterium]|nr:ferrous iron transporter B [bacterium]
EIHDHIFLIADLPGTYSLTAYSPEELYVRDYIAKNTPDVVVNVVDASNLERNLYLTTQLIDMDIKVVLALNMYDELEGRGDKFDYDSLSKMIGIPIIPTVSSKGKGISELFRRVIQVYEDKDPVVRHIHINYGEMIENAILELQMLIKEGENSSVIYCYSPRFLSVKMLENDNIVKKILKPCSNYNEISEGANKHIKFIELNLHDDCETIITDSKYGFIAGALKETYEESDRVRRKTEIIDTILTHKLFG